MLTRATILSLVAVSLAAIGGVGYATFTSTVNVSATATAGTLALVLSSPTAATVTAGDTITACSASLDATGRLVISASNLFPGDAGCTFSVAITNTGSLPATAFVVDYANVATTCSGTLFPGSGAFSACFSYSDTLGGTSTGFPFCSPHCPVAVSLQPGASFTYSSTIAMRSGVGNAAQGLSDSALISITGSIGS